MLKYFPKKRPLTKGTLWENNVTLIKLNLYTNNSNYMYLMLTYIKTCHVDL